MLEEFRPGGFNDNFRDDESLIQSGVLDSLSILKLISFLDEEFNVSLDEDEFEPEKLETIDRIAGLVAGKLDAEQPGK